MRIGDDSSKVQPLKAATQPKKVEEADRIDCPTTGDLPKHSGVQTDIAQIMTVMNRLPRDVPKVLGQVKKEVKQHKNFYFVIGKGHESSGIIRVLIQAAIGRQ